MRQTTFGRALAESLLLVAALVGFHLLQDQEVERHPLLTALSVLLAFFLPPLWGALRLAPPRQAETPRVLQGAAFGLVLGLLAGVVGGIEKLAQLAMAGATVPVALAVWLMVAVFFAVASAVAYALLVLSVLALLAINRDPAVVQRAIFPDRPLRAVDGRTMEAASRSDGSGEPGRASERLVALAYSLVPGLGQYYLGDPGRGVAFLLLALELALAAFSVALAGLVVFWEARATTIEPFLVLAAALALSPLLLVLLAALDVLLRRWPPRAPTAQLPPAGA